MKYAIVVARDSAADAYGVPMFLPSVGMAIRSFTQEVNRADDKNQLYMNPEDFELFHVGFYDDEKPTFDLLPVPKSIVRAADVKEG